MNDVYFALRLAEELRLAERSASEAERAVRLRACALLCCILGLGMEPRLKRMRRHQLPL